jgi:ApeA N-terminal domain 1
MRVSVGEATRRRDGSGPQTRDNAFIDGVWWPVGHEELEAPGKVSAFGDGSVWLDLSTDAWGAVALADDTERVDVRVLFGRSSSGTPMSLHGGRLIGGEKEVFGGPTHVRYIADRLVHGAAVESESELRLTSVATSFRGLREWLVGSTRETSTPLPLVRPMPAANANLRSGERLSRPRPIRSALRASRSWPLRWWKKLNPPAADDVLESGDRVDEWLRSLSMQIDGVRVKATVDRSLASTSRFRTIYDTSASLWLEADDALTLTDWRRLWIDPLRDLILFATREQTVTLYLSGYTGPERTYPPVSVYMAPETTLHPPQHAEYYQRDLLPAGIWDQEGFPDLIDAWRTLHLQLGAVGQAFFELQNSTDAPLTRLLRLTSCAEGYHRALHDEPPFTDEEHDAMVAAMTDALPEDRGMRSHYRDRLRYANSQSQRQRMRWLIERAAKVDERLEGRTAKLTNRLVGWRNEHTHLAGDVVAPSLDDLLLLNAVLTYVLEANILLDIGIDENAPYCLVHGYVWDDPIGALVGDGPGHAGLIKPR